MRQRWAVTGLAVLAALTFGTTACTTAGTPSASATPTKSAVETLSAAADKTKGQSYQFSLTYGTLMTGQGMTTGDGTGTSLKMTIADAATGVVIKADALVLATDAYVKVDLGALGSAVPGLGGGDKWMHVDPAKAPGLARLGIKPGSDTFGAASYVKGVVSAQAVSPTEITGTLDLAKSALPGVSSEEVAKLSPEAHNVPFTVTLDDQGRVSKIVIKLPAIGTFPASDQTTTYSNWGATVDAKKPAAAETVEAPELLYLFLK